MNGSDLKEENIEAKLAASTRLLAEFHKRSDAAFAVERGKLKEEIISLTSEINGLKRDKASLQTRINELEGNLKTAHSESEGLRQDLQSSRAECSDMRKMPKPAEKPNKPSVLHMEVASHDASGRIKSIVVKPGA